MQQLELPAERFTFTGRLPYPQYSDLLQRIDLFLYPVRYGSGNWGLLELLTRGCPVIAARRCYVPEIIEQGQNGLLVDGHDPADWAAAASQLAGDAGERRRLSEAARERGRSYHLQEVAPRYMDLFRSVIENREDD